jgi:hypothetical protein
MIQSIRVQSIWKFFFLLSLSAQASVQVAFFECRTSKEELIPLEKNGRFCHVAIQVLGGWVEAHPLYGVRLTKSLSEIGEPAEVLEHKAYSASKRKAKKVVGLPYDYNFNWNKQHSYYCSKLVAKLIQGFDFKLKKMSFSTSYWGFKRGDLPIGALGISPDDVYQQLKQKKFKRIQTGCVQYF